MTKERKPGGDEDDGLIIIPMQLASPEDLPDFAADSMEAIQSWVEKYAPEDLRESILATIRQVREANQPSPSPQDPSKR